MKSTPELTAPRTEEEYSILQPTRHHSRRESSTDLQEHYIYLTSVLIDRIASGADNDPSKPFDTVMFLDKSARPVAWMLKELWPSIAPQKIDEATGEVRTMEMPQIKFANIDRLHWRIDPDQEIVEGGKMREPTLDEIQGLRSIYDVDEQHTISGQNVLIVDEQKESGDTLAVAQDLFSRAFPESRFESAAWISHPYRYTTNGEKVYDVSEIPVWYPKKDAQKLHAVEGRAVYDPRDIDPSDPRDPLRRIPQAGRQFLSSRPRILKDISMDLEAQKELTYIDTQLAIEQDEAVRSILLGRRNQIRYETIDQKGLKLRREIGAMALDFVHGKLHPSIVTDRVEIAGLPADEYHALAAATKKKRATKSII